MTLPEHVPASGPGATGPSLAGRAAQAVATTTEATTYGAMLVQLAAAGAALRGVGARVRGTYEYVQDCARSVEHLADTCAGLNVDADTVGEHRQAATVARSVLARAERMANRIEEMSGDFEAARAAHQADYGPVNDVKHGMSVPMADRGFYRNR